MIIYIYVLFWELKVINFLVNCNFILGLFFVIFFIGDFFWRERVRFFKKLIEVFGWFKKESVKFFILNLSCCVLECRYGDDKFLNNEVMFESENVFIWYGVGDNVMKFLGDVMKFILFFVVCDEILGME